MKMDYSVKAISIPSRWFDPAKDKKENTFQKIGGHKGFYLYLQLYKFRVHSQDNEHTFVTCISFLRKETGYTTNEVFELLKRLKNAKVISIAGASRWEYLLNDKGEIIEDKALIITVSEKESFPIHSDFDKRNEFYIYVSFKLLKMYEEKKLDAKYFALHCLIQRMQRNEDGVCFMSIEVMSEILKLDKDTINRMINTLNREYLLVSFRKSNKHRRGEGSYKFDHIAYEDNEKYADKDKSISNWDGWLFRHQEAMDVIANRAKRKAKSKSKQREKKASKKSQVKSKCESNDSFENVDDQYIAPEVSYEVLNTNSLSYQEEEIQMSPIEDCFSGYVNEYMDYQEVGIQNYKKYKEPKKESQFKTPF